MLVGCALDCARMSDGGVVQGDREVIAGSQGDTNTIK
jgi:hypothetical protein